MARSIGVLATGRIWAGMVDDTTLGDVRTFPGGCEDEHLDLKSLPVDAIIGAFAQHVRQLRQGAPIDSVGAGFPGIVRDGMIEESPNLGQLKGLQMRERLAAALRAGRPRRSGLRDERRRRAGRRRGRHAGRTSTG